MHTQHLGGVIIGSLIGFQHRSLALKVQAQALPSRVKIEENTRK
jgi:hypothetical protein